MTAAFQASATVSGDIGQLEAFKRQVKVLLSEESDIQNFQEQYILQDLIYRFETNQGIPFPAFVTTSAVFPDLKIRVEWVNRREQMSGSALIENGKLTEHHTQSLAKHERATDEVLHDIEIEENGYLRQAIACKAVGANEYTGYLLSGRQQAVFKISRRGNAVELYASDGLEAQWAERWTYHLESKQKNRQELSSREDLPEILSQKLEALVNDFLAEWVWFAESAPEDIAIERQRYERMGLATHEANIKAEKVGKMRKGASPQGTAYAYSTLDTDCAWIKTVIAACWTEQ